jgi:tryptophan synthase beta chain
VACTGGGSNFGGLAFPILREKMAGKVGANCGKEEKIEIL